MFAVSTSTAQQTVTDSTKTTVPLDEVIISAIRADEQTPVTFTNLSKAEIAKRNLGQDIPILMNFMPSVVTTSDAGAGVGYTGIRVRGSDATRVNVTINGIPYNDPESQGTFWVNMPDFASSVESLQLQRGVGTSTNGSGAFGASLNLLTASYSPIAKAEISNSLGSFNTRKHTVNFSTGLLNEKFELAGRLSNITSDGYIDRAFSDLKSYFLQGTYVGKSTLIKALVFGGTERTYQSWNGLEDPEKLKNDRTYNTAGEYTDNSGNIAFYDNETDNYQQDHYQLHWSEKITANWNTNLALHYTKGRGFYENYKVDEDLADYNLQPQVINGEEVASSDIIRQKWLDNDFYGTTFSANYKTSAFNFILGGGWNKYDGSHFGNVLYARSIVLPVHNYEYYNDSSTKTDFNVFAKANIDLSEKLSLFGDLQYRAVTYRADGDETGIIDDDFGFFNPKAGITFNASSKSNFYLSYARANREPNRTDYSTGNPAPESMDDFELGWRYSASRTRLNINGYYMKYQNQLILTGALDDVGNPIRENSGNSFRAGIEIDASVNIGSKFIVRPNLTVSANKNEDFVFQRDGVLQNLGQTNIAFSPNVVFGNILTYMPVKNLQISLMSKFVGDQYMANIDSDASKLDAYGVSDLNIYYEIKPQKVFKAIVFSALINNIFDYEYESNGYFYTYDDNWTDPASITTIEGAGYYPQAGTNFLLGMTLLF
ncbi:MAG TPA: TonB-dependent receptor [Flavobacterium sp.]